MCVEDGRPFDIHFGSVRVQKLTCKFTTIGSGVLRTTTHRKECSFDGLISDAAASSAHGENHLR
jgi:hypothetical protein